MKAILDRDLIIGTVTGHCNGIEIPVYLHNHKLYTLRFNGEDIVSISQYKKFYIDKTGIKHIIQHNSAWQPLVCDFDDELILENGIWRIKNNNDKYNETINSVSAKRRSDYIKEADPLKNEYDYDLIVNPGNADAKKHQWIAKVKEIKARYPFPSKATFNL
ncbi:hypothetical protein [Zooshikella harenae]|uniref:Uncharacterized protein n=1 Tax=Zooshikella harenae TaxID=2827238 RepID=A0ABS5ZCY2_9GAMM|nr:hypothetical protein [Zooshikella harenae]MBU2710802.1 hypothetical protein [Zooshikella harenae]